jgi:hypothetical protein
MKQEKNMAAGKRETLNFKIHQNESKHNNFSKPSIFNHNICSKDG